MQDRTDLAAEGGSDQSPPFETSLAELEAIVHDLEEGRLGLAESLDRYEQGVKHLRHCYALLQRAERKIELLTGITDEGTPITEPLENISEDALPEAAGRRRTRRAGSAAAPPLDIAEPDSDIDD